MKFFTIPRCPHCGHNSRELFAINYDVVTDLIVQRKALREDLNTTKVSEIVLGLNTPDRSCNPCSHLLLMHVAANPVDTYYPNGQPKHAYEANWLHPAFATHFDAATAQELASRLITENPRGHAVWGELGSDFCDLAYVNSDRQPDAEDCPLERIKFQIEARALYVPDPAAFLIAYHDFVRGFACPCGAHGWPAERSTDRLWEADLIDLEEDEDDQDTKDDD